MYPCIACEPPVGLTTVAKSQEATFYVAVSDNGADIAEVAIWHNGQASRSWTDFLLQPTKTATNDDIRSFSGSFTPPVTPVNFTLKYRKSSGDWQWLNDQNPQRDGVLVIPSQTLPSRLEDCFEGWHAAWHVEQRRQSSESSSSWILSANAPPSSESQSSWISRSIGKPRDLTKWLALVRHSRPWLGPRHGDTKFTGPDKEAVLACFLRADGNHVVLLPLNGVPHVLTTINGDDEAHVIMTTRNDAQEAGKSILLVAVSKSADDAIETVVNIARRLLRRKTTPGSGSTTSTTPEQERWYDGFTYCTWNGFGQQLSEDKILRALDQLESDGLDIHTLIIDDLWQSVDFQGGSNFDFKWTEFEANKENFPNGLGHAIRKIRESHPRVKHIGVWHGMFGYWGGMDPAGNIVKHYGGTTAPTQTQEHYLSNHPVTFVPSSEIHRMYDDFYAFLVSCGVDCVKTDNFFYPDYLLDANDRRDTVYTYQDAWTSAVEKHFQHRAIACMSQTPQILFHTFLAPSDRPPYLMRNSDDFFPDEPTSHAWHIFCNSHNALLTRHFNLLPDWDMFQTAGQYARMHAVARCLSGGPIYITDPPGQHDFEVLDAMSAKSIDGRSIALRPESVAAALEIYVKPHSDRLLRLGTTHQGVSFVGLFNVGERPVDEIVMLESFPGVEARRDYIIVSHFGKWIKGPMSTKSALPFVTIHLDVQEADIYTAVPVQDVGGARFALLGLLGKMTGPAAIRDYKVKSASDGGTMAIVKLKAIGTFGLWTDCEINGVSAVLNIGKMEMAVEIMQDSPQLFALDLEKAWRQAGETTELQAKLVLRIGP